MAEAEAVFHTIKARLADLILPAHPAPNAPPTTLTTDASSEAVGAVLQQDMDGALPRLLQQAS